MTKYVIEIVLLLSAAGAALLAGIHQRVYWFAVALAVGAVGIVLITSW